MNSKNEPLVSIIIVTYNSSDYVLETLESAKNQTYQNIELIVTDDSSTDNTIEICNSWIKKNKQRFARTELILVKKNTGISFNCNRGLFVSRGDWIKFIAGDDVLLPNCINDNINFTKSNKKAKFIFSKYNYLIDDEISPTYYFRRPFFRKNNKKQYKSLLKGVGVNSATSFVARIDLMKLGGFNNDYPFLEDAPMWLEASKKGYKIFGFEKSTVIYRIHSGNSCLSNTDVHVNLNYYNSKKKFYNQKIKPQLIKRNNYITLFSNFVDYKINDYIISKGNKKSDYNLKLKILNLFNINRLIGFNGYFNKHNDSE